MRIGKTGILLVVAVIAAVTMLYSTGRNAQATIHEGPVASWCALMAITSQNETGAPLNPPGLSGRSAADNIAQPLIAAGMIIVEMVTPEGVFLAPNVEHPAVKVHLLEGYTPVEPGVFIRNFEPDPEFAAFKHCPNLGGHDNHGG